MSLTSDRYANDQVLGKWLSELQELESFEAQVEIENRLLNSARAKLESLDLSDPNLASSFVRARAEIDALKKLQSLRSKLIDERNNPRSPALKEKKSHV